MDKFTPQKIDLAAINEGNRYGYEGIHPDAINRPIEASAYAQEIAESVKGLALNQPDSSQADIVGTPTVEISGTGENAKFVFKSLKGKQGLTGPSGVASGTVNSNAEGTSDTDGYTQQAVNKIASRPNLLINPDFSINQRGEEFYVADDSNFYTVDRIYLHKYAIPVLEQKNGGGISLSGTSVQAQQFIISYLVEEFKKYAGKTLTLSIKFKNVTGTGVRVRTSSTGTGDYSASITTDMLYTKTFTVAENPTELSIRLTTGVAGDFSFDVDWWKLEVGSVATAFIPPVMAEELPKCQRYYQRFTTNSDYREYGIGFISSTTTAHIMIPLGVEMRINNPTLSISDISHFSVRYGSNNGNVVQTTISKMELRSYSKSGFFVTATLANTLSFEYGVASLRPTNIYGYISLNAEIYN